MTWLFTLLAVTVIALAAGVVTGRISGGMDPAPSSSPFRGLPPEGTVPADLEALRFTPALRGYRMDEVDRVLDQLALELRRRDDEISRLHAVLRGEVDADPLAAEAATLADPGAPGAASPFVPPGPASPFVPPDASTPFATQPTPALGETRPEASAGPATPADATDPTVPVGPVGPVGPSDPSDASSQALSSQKQPGRF